jgi:hypothetical protein
LIDLANIIRESNQEVPQWYINMCGVVLHSNKKRGRFGGRDIRRGTGRDKNFGRKNRHGGGRRDNNNHGRKNHRNNRRDNYRHAGHNKNNNYDRQQNQQQYQNMRQFQEPQQQTQPQSLQNYQAYNYTPTAQAQGFVGYPTAAVTKIQLDAGGYPRHPQSMAYVPSPKNATPNMDFQANPAMAIGSISPTDAGNFTPTAAVPTSAPVYTFS